jgi:hypothetical protein
MQQLNGNPPPDSVERLFIVLWGEIKTAKTTFALTAPMPLVHLDFDQSLDRALWRFPHLKCIKLDSPVSAEAMDTAAQTYDVIAIQYRQPIKWPGTAPKGFMDFENEVANDLRIAYENPTVKTIGIDTGTLMWNVATQAHLERVQRRSTEKDRQSLIQIEYSRPNADMRAFLEAARIHRKNLVSIHHVGGLYKETLVRERKESVRVGDTWDGWNRIGGLADVKPQLDAVDIRQGKSDLPILHIDTCGLTLSAENVEVPLDFDTLLNTINAFRRL